MKNVCIPNPLALKRKLDKIKKDGLSKFHVISDFDRTLTKYIIDGKPISSAISLIRHGGYLTEDYPRKAFDLYNKYHPIEINENLPLKYRSQKMQEWWETHEKLLVESGMNEQVIEDILKKYPNILREGISEFLDVLHKYKIPLLIFSSGVGNIIEGYINKYDNIHILSNTFKFNKKGLATGYKDKIIHVLNKSETEIKDKKYLASITKRKNVLLLGDSISDLNMVKGIKHDIIIKIGFLNENVNENLDLFKKNFDVIILNDGSMDYVNKLLKRMTIL